MNQTRVMLSLGSLLGLAFAGQPGARAQITLTYAASVQTAPAGSLLTYSGVLTNTTGATVFLNGDAFAPLATGFTLDDTPFFLNAPLSLLPNASTANIALFTVQLSSALANGAAATDTFQIIGGANGNAQAVVGSAAFTARVGTAPAVPEPGAVALLAGIGGASAFALIRRKRAVRGRWR